MTASLPSPSRSAGEAIARRLPGNPLDYRLDVRFRKRIGRVDPIQHVEPLETRRHDHHTLLHIAAHGRGHGTYLAGGIEHHGRARPDGQGRDGDGSCLIPTAARKDGAVGGVRGARVDQQGLAAALAPGRPVSQRSANVTRGLECISRHRKQSIC